MFDAKNCPFLPQETQFTAFLSRMSQESQHTRFEDQILGQVSLWGRPACSARLHINKYLWIFIILCRKFLYFSVSAGVKTWQILSCMVSLSIQTGALFPPQNSHQCWLTGNMVIDTIIGINAPKDSEEGDVSPLKESCHLQMVNSSSVAEKPSPSLLSDATTLVVDQDSKIFHSILFFSFQHSAIFSSKRTMPPRLLSAWVKSESKIWRLSID